MSRGRRGNDCVVARHRDEILVVMQPQEGDPTMGAAGERQRRSAATGHSALLGAIVGRRTIDSMDRRRMAILLATLVLLVLASPIADVAGQGRLVISAGSVWFLLACLQQAAAYPRFRLSSRLLVLLWLILNLPLPWSESVWVTSAAAAILAALILSMLWLVALRLVKADRVDAELLCGAFGAYLLLGVFWALTYDIISAIAPASFASPGGVAPSRSALLYFSFTTLTTTGYGDITAVNPVVRMWSIFEAIIGTMYNATVIARLVSLYGRQIRRGDR
jgi:voltage-gated potassium channel